jgi:hypothetical protein
MVPQAPQGGKGAEAFLGFISGNRSHGVAFLVSDRRYRLYKLKPGEVANHDDQTQQRHIARDGIYDSVPNNYKVHVRVMKSSDNVSGDGSSQQYGQTAWQAKTPYAYHGIDKTSRTVQHPGTIQHQITDTATQSSIVHFLQLVQNSGILHSVFQGQHTLALSSGGIAAVSSIAIGLQAPNTNVTGPLNATQNITSLGAMFGTAFNISSDRRLKENFRRAKRGLSTLLRIKVVEFNLKSDPAKARVQGFVAQDLARVYPEAVVVGETPDAMLSIDSGRLVALAVKAIQDQQRQIRGLRYLVAALALAMIVWRLWT